MAAEVRQLADTAAGCLERGDFLDGLVEPLVLGLVAELKAACQMELQRAQKAGEAADGSSELLASLQSKHCARGDSASSTVGSARSPRSSAPSAPSGSDHPGGLRRAAVECQRSSAPLAPPSLEPSELDVEAGLPIACRVPGLARSSSSLTTVAMVAEASSEASRRTSKCSASSDPSHYRGSLARTEPRGIVPRQVSSGNADLLAIKKMELMEEEDALRHPTRASELRRLDTTHMTRSRRAVVNLIANPIFDSVMGAVIIANSIAIGLESSIAVHGAPSPIYLQVLEHMFLSVYIAELLLRFYASSVRAALKSSWVRFDAMLIVIGVANFFLSFTSFTARTVSNVYMLKMVRLFRLARTVRLLAQFRTMWLLVQGLLHAALPMIWTCILMIFVSYLFAVIGMEIIARPDSSAEYREAAKNFGTIWDSMLFLVQFLSLDSVALVYKPLMRENPWLVIYFLGFFLIGPVALMNIVTAIMVESSLRTADQDSDMRRKWMAMKKKQMMPKLRALFEALDADGSSEVNIEELAYAPEELKDQITRIVNLEELYDVFHILDMDGSGAVNLDEFMEAIMRTQDDKPSELLVVVKLCKTIVELLHESTRCPSADAERSGIRALSRFQQAP